MGRPDPGRIFVKEISKVYYNVCPLPKNIFNFKVEQGMRILI